MSSRRPPALALVVLAVLGCAAGLAAAPRTGTRARPWRALEVSARRAPSFELLPMSRRDDAVLRTQPQIQLLGAGTPLARAKLARLQAGRIRRPAAAGRARPGADTDVCSGRPSGAAAARLRAPPSPA
jgi:hypothetical protein